MLTGAAERIAQARILSLHGMNHDAWKRYSAEGSWYYEVVTPGYKYNMTDIQSAIGQVQLQRMAAMQAKRQRVVAQYNTAFAPLAELEIPTCRPNVDHAWHLYVLRLRLERLSIDRATFIKELAARNIGTSVHFIPIHLHPYYRDKYEWQSEAFPVAYREYQRLISLPLNSSLTDADVQDVIQAVVDVVDRFRC